MIRGALSILAYRLFRGDDPADTPPELLSLASAMELIQSGFLVHDDVMDRDEWRRGGMSIYSQYADLAARQGLHDSYHIGESLGICAGDVAFFLAFELLGGVGANSVSPLSSTAASRAAELGALCARELSFVGVAQMMDVYWGRGYERIPLEEVLSLYRFKTGRYSFSLPLRAGALLADAEEEQADILDRMGELLGVLFQLKDDELGIFGDARQLGKPVGSDLKEGKKTPFLVLLLEKVTTDEAERIRGVLGASSIDEEELGFVRGLIEDYGVRREMNELCLRYAEQARGILGQLEGTDRSYRMILESLLEYSLKRSS